MSNTYFQGREKIFRGASPPETSCTHGRI